MTIRRQRKARSAGGERSCAGCRPVRAVALAIAAAAALAIGGCGGSDEAAAGKVRTYYIAADEVAWDYAPQGRDMITGKPFGEDAQVFVKRGRDRIGRVYLKSVFRRYTDKMFDQRAPVPERWRHLGVLGPQIHAEVGDTIRLVFKNNTREPAGVHPHGVFYAKDSEGSPYDDGTSGADKRDDAVKPGATHTYVWKVPERSGPASGDESSVAWMYHGHADEVKDTYAGLMGPLIVTRKGMARANGSPKDVDRELFSLFMVLDENQSPYLQRNIRRYAREPSAVDVDDEDFAESNLMHSINGYVYGNGPEIELRRGEMVRWYTMSMGTEVDLHTPHWHGNTVTADGGHRTDVVSLLPASMAMADMQPDDPGTWLFHCHVNDHIIAGMSTRYTVR
ncbi:MAG: multicopper oxidase domain-containing protein [Actinobacteria bacterium]|nr:multicopper oxidase domain-containing protein [Actinomycetota bacterium]